MRSITRVPTGTGGLAPVPAPDDIQLLDAHTGERRAGGQRVDWLATLSLGTKDARGIPTVSRETDARWLHAHGADDAPALLAALEAGQYRRLTISLAGDTWGEIVQQHYAAYSQSACQIYGDAEQLTYITMQPVVDFRTGEIQKGQMEPVHQQVWKRDDPERYARMLQLCKVQTSIFFYLAEWVGSDTSGWEPRVVFDGDVGLYRLRTAGSHTPENLAAAVKQIRKFTGGYVKGIPLTLGVSFPEVAGPDGKKRKIPTCTFRLQPPFRISGVNFAPMLQAAVAEGQALALPAPARETLESELLESPYLPDVITTDDREVDLVARGGRCAVGRYTRLYFALVKGMPEESDAGRQQLVRRYSNGATDSLSELLQWSTNDEADAFLAWVDRDVLGNEPDDPEPERWKPAPGESEAILAAMEDSGAVDRAVAARRAALAEPSIRQRSAAEPDPSENLVNVAAPEDSTVETPTGQVIDAATGEILDPAEPEPEDGADELLPADIDTALQIYEAARLMGLQVQRPPEKAKESVYRAYIGALSTSMRQRASMDDLQELPF